MSVPDASQTRHDVTLVQRLRLQWDRIAAWVFVVAGALVLILGYLGASSKVYTGEEIPYVISGGIGGIFLLGLGGILWLSADLRDEWIQLDQIEELLARKADPAVVES